MRTGGTRRPRRLETRRSEELDARHAKRARLLYEDAVEKAEEEEDGMEEQAGSLRGVLAFEMIHSDDLWRHILEFL